MSGAKVKASQRLGLGNSSDVERLQLNDYQLETCFVRNSVKSFSAAAVVSVVVVVVADAAVVYVDVAVVVAAVVVGPEQQSSFV